MIEIRQTEAFSRWLGSLRDHIAKAQIASRLRRLAFGHFGDVKSVGEGVAELRIASGPGYRVYFLQQGDEIVLLLCGGDKGGQARDIERAKALAREIRSNRS